MDLVSVQKTLNDLVQQRAKSRETANRQEESWKLPTRRRQQRMRRENALAWADLAGTIKGLAPPPPPPSIETGPPGSDEPGVVRPATNAFIGLHTQPSGISRGHVEQVLGYLVDLGGEDQEDGGDAAA